MFQRLTSLIFLLIPASTLFFACTNADSIRIDGKATEVAGKKLYVERMEPSFVRRIDSTVVAADGKFTIKIKPASSEPYFLMLKTDSLHIATLLVEKGERVKLSYASGAYEVEGSKGSQQLRTLDSIQQNSQRKMDSLYSLFGGDGFTKQEAIAAINKVLIEQKRNNIRFIVTNPTSYASIIAINELFVVGMPMFNKAEDFHYYQLLLDSLQPKYPKALFVGRLKEQYGKMKNEVALAEKLSSATVLDGSPDIELPDKDGNKVALSSLRGKVALLHFWSADIKGSQLQNRELINLFDKYHSKGFAIYQVCVDKDRVKWIRTVEQQDLPWVSVCDGYGEGSYAVRTYNVQQLPASFLLDRSGTIVAKDIWGDELEKKVASLLSK